MTHLKQVRWINFWQSIALAAAGLCIAMAIAHLQPASATEPIAPRNIAPHDIVNLISENPGDRLAQTTPALPEQPMTKRQLITAVLQELGVSERYDQYLGNAVDLAVSPNQSLKFINWLNEVLKERAGWKTVALNYSRRLDSQFSETELQELLNLAQNPTLRKLFRSELESYSNTARDRRMFLFRVWDDYNNGNIPIPEGMF
ncbi:MAG: hypothetical protein ACAF42_07870 [Limnothrix sp. BL-A-16]